MSEPEPEQAQELDRTPGLVVWNELASRDATASAEFYGGLFGWKSADMGLPGHPYQMFTIQDGRTAGGLLQMLSENGSIPSQWIPYVNVADLDASVTRAAELGARILRPATELPFGRFAVIKDPQGATIGLWQGKG